MNLFRTCNKTDVGVFSDGQKDTTITNKDAVTTTTDKSTMPHETCEEGFYGDALNSQCMECQCDPLGTDPER